VGVFKTTTTAIPLLKNRTIKVKIAVVEYR
jgi:hypothetical protein